MSKLENGKCIPKKFGIHSVTDSATGQVFFPSNDINYTDCFCKIGGFRIELTKLSYCDPNPGSCYKGYTHRVLNADSRSILCMECIAGCYECNGLTGCFKCDEHHYPILGTDGSIV